MRDLEKGGTKWRSYGGAKQVMCKRLKLFRSIDSRIAVLVAGGAEREAAKTKAVGEHQAELAKVPKKGRSKAWNFAGYFSVLGKRAAATKAAAKAVGTAAA